MTITLQHRREEAIRVGHLALSDRISIPLEEFFRVLEPWNVDAFCDGDKVVGMLMTKDAELHVAVLPEVRGKWLSKRLIREVLGPLVRKYGEAQTSVQPENKVGNDFVMRLGFKGAVGEVLALRHGFATGTFDPITAIAGANVVGGLIGADAAGNAADTQAGAAKYAADQQYKMFQTINDQQAPWREAGMSALSDIAALKPQFTHSFNADDLKTNLAPNYQFQLDQGLGATKNAANLQTGLLSGNTLKGINDYAQNFAGNAYQQAFNNYNAQQSNIFNRLSSIAGLGQTANQTTAQAGTTAAQNAGNATMAAGGAQAAGTVGAANALTGGLNNASSWYGLKGLLNPASSAIPNWSTTYSNSDLDALGG